MDIQTFNAMDFFTSYCKYVEDLPLDNPHRVYHDTEYGFPIESDDELFERLVLEINQAGLSWITVLKKKENFRRAFDNFKVAKVAAYDTPDMERLLNDAGIIRNRQKIKAAIHNAKVILEIQKEHGSFKNWLDANYPKSLEEWTALFKKTFTFTGREIVNEFLLSISYLPGSHNEDCEIYQKIRNHPGFRS